MEPNPGNFALFLVVLLTAVGTLVICQGVPFQTPSPFTENKWLPNQNNLSGQGISAGFPKPTVAPSAKKVYIQDEDLRIFSEDLLQRDYNNLAKYIIVQYQGLTNSRSHSDEAPFPLLQIHKDAYNVPTVNKLMQLLDNYVADATAAEDNTYQERQEENLFLDKILETQVMQYTQNFLIQKGKIHNSPQEFKNILKDIWFGMYPRAGKNIGSSGFEHVFVGEIKNREVSGLHSWVYFGIAEANQVLNYLGYMKKIEFGNKGSVLKYRFKLNNVEKPVTSMFIGTSPELEIALYTVCFLLKPDQVCPVRLGGHNFVIRTYTYRYNGKTLIGSAFAEI